MDLRRLFRSQLERELYADRTELQRLLLLPDDSDRFKQLCSLASKLGASTLNVTKGYTEASQPEVIYNIHIALQTKAMIAAVTTSSNYVLVTIILALIALASLVASYIALFSS